MNGTFYAMGIMIGIALGLILAKGIEDVDTRSYKNQVKMAIEVCEHDLPRYQHCVIQGVVEKK